MAHPLDNPMWNSLVSRHANVALGNGMARRYPADTAPFAGIAQDDEASRRDLVALVSPGDSVGMLNVFPTDEATWEVVKVFDCVQMIWDSGDEVADPEIIWMTPDDLPAMLELTALVYPAYFRPGTAELGPYCGIKDGDRLAAMAGIRMSMPEYQEISAVCTHPDYRGRAYAKRLMRHLVAHIRTGGDVPFLHTESDNEAALALYEGIGFKRRALLPYRGLRRH